MLLVWDIHINTRYHEKILTELRTIFAKYPEEKNIIFSWDYVYHFAYDRNALLQLYKLFLELFSEGKNVYILAGNHDRLGNSFVFEEAQKAFNIMQNAKFRIQNKEWGKIQFITKPQKETIEGEDILFLPFFLPTEEEKQENITSPKNEKLKAIYDFSTLLEDSKNKNEIFSWYINKFLAQQISEHPNSTIIHHYYINGTAFPGQKSKFNYKDVALNEQFLDMPNCKFISGHLHQGFTYKNYFCLGSVRSTSPLEINQNKYIFHYNTNNKEITALPIQVNPQILIQNKEIITETILQEEIQKINEANKSYFNSEQRNIVFNQKEFVPTKNIALTVQVEHIDYDKIDEVIDPELRKTCKDLRLKKKTENLDSLLSSFKVSSDELSGFSDRKNILQEYTQKKFGTEYPKYEKVLKELKLL